MFEKILLFNEIRILIALGKNSSSSLKSLSDGSLIRVLEQRFEIASFLWVWPRNIIFLPPMLFEIITSLFWV